MSKFNFIVPVKGTPEDLLYKSIDSIIDSINLLNPEDRSKFSLIISETDSSITYDYYRFNNKIENFYILHQKEGVLLFRSRMNSIEMMDLNYDDYVVFCDADDSIDKYFCQNLLESYNKDPNKDLYVGTVYEIFNSSLRRIWRRENIRTFSDVVASDYFVHSKLFRVSCFKTIMENPQYDLFWSEDKIIHYLIFDNVKSVGRINSIYNYYYRAKSKSEMTDYRSDLELMKKYKEVYNKFYNMIMDASYISDNAKNCIKDKNFKLEELNVDIEFNGNTTYLKYYGKDENNIDRVVYQEYYWDEGRLTKDMIEGYVSRYAGFRGSQTYKINYKNEVK